MTDARQTGGTNADVVSVPDVDARVNPRLCACARCGRCDVRCGRTVTGRAMYAEGCREAHRHRSSRAPEARQRAQRQRRFFGIDGESVDGRYVLLAAATDDGWSDYIEPRRGESELRTDDCLRFIARLPTEPGDLVWGFVFGYDVNMLLGDVRPAVVRRLYETGHCYVGLYSVQYTPRKLLRVTERDRMGKGARKRAGTTVWDMFPWQQSSFASWLETDGLASPAEVERIRTMKHKRSSFDRKHRKQIIDYCISECTYLSRGARHLLNVIAGAGLSTGGRYHSPAALPKEQMRARKIDQYMAEPPSHLVGPIDAAKYGGRAEVGQSGPIAGPVWQHDIRSAYPTEMVNLPCLAHGRWVRGVEEGWTLCKVRWRPLDGKRHATWGPFPSRAGTASLWFPTTGTGWYWGVEVDAARRISEVDVVDAWTFVPGCDHQPFAYIPEMYAQRQRLKAEGVPAEYSLKLALASGYGVLAEREHAGQRYVPRWRNYMWAGLITAGTRARMLGLLDDSVVMIATDGIFATKPLPVDEGAALGDWEVSEYESMWIAGTGFYFPRVGGDWTAPKTRGFAAYDIDRDRLIGMWDRDGREGKYTDTRSRFIGMGTAMHRVNGMWPPYERLWRQFIEEPVTKTFNLYPRREWLTRDIHDGRSRAPSRALQRRTANLDSIDIAALRADVEKRQKKLQWTIDRAEKKGIPWVGVGAPLERKVQRLIIDVKHLEVLEHGIDNTDVLARTEQPMGESDVGL